MNSLFIKEELRKRGFDLESDLLFQNNKYEELKKEYMLFPGLGAITVDYFIEKHILSQEQVNKMKSGSFDINVNKELQLDKLTASALYLEIYQDEVAGKDEKEADKVSVENIRQEIEGTTSGLKVKLKKNFNFDFNNFNGQQYQKLKLIKLLYKMHKQENRLYDILGKPSLECVDNTVLNCESVYGQTLALLKNEIMKEIASDFIVEVKAATVSVCVKWEQIIQNVTYKLLFLDEDNLTYELKRIAKFLGSIIERLPKIDELDIPYKHSVFETFYFKLIQYECIGRQNDLCLVNSYEPKIEEVSNINIKQYLQILSEPVHIEGIEVFITDNIEMLAKLVYMTNSINEEDKRLITDKISIKCLNNFLEIWQRNTISKDMETISLLLLVSCIQEIITSYKTKERYMIKFFGYKTEHSTLISKLKSGVDTREVYQILWVRKVKQRIYANMGLKRQADLLTLIERSVDTLAAFAMRYHNIEDMIIVNDYFVSKLEMSVVNNIDIADDISDMAESMLKKSGYFIEILHGNVFNYFKETSTMDLGNQVIAKILNEIYKLERGRKCSPHSYITMKGYRTDLELLDKNGESPRDFLLVYRIDIERKCVSFENFWEVKSNRYINEMVSLGLKKFFIV
jgi:hypothetical protein